MKGERIDWPDDAAVLRLLAKEGGVVAAARALGVPTSTLSAMLARRGLRAPPRAVLVAAAARDDGAPVGGAMTDADGTKRPDRDGVWRRLWCSEDGQRHDRHMLVRGTATARPNVTDLRKATTRSLAAFDALPGWWLFVRADEPEGL